MKIHKHGKHIKTINTVIESCLIVILIVLVAIMMVLIGKLQGTARVINYTGLVRGATQREVKLEITGNPNDELINYLDGILEDLKYKDGDYNLIKLDDNDYEKKLDTQIAFWILLKDEIYKVREYGYENSDIVKTTYGETTSDSSTFIYHDNNTNSITTTSNLYSAKGKVFEVFSDIYYISNDFSRILGLNIRNDTYNNAECYVLKFNNSSTDYRELWINKETKLPVRELQQNSNGYYFERTFKLESNSVTDTDILLNK